MGGVGGVATGTYLLVELSFFSAFRFDIRNMLLFTSYPFPARSGKCGLGFYMYSSSLVLE